MSKGWKIFLVVFMGITMMSLSILDFISKINNQTIKPIDYWILIAAFFSILVLTYITWLQLKGDNENEKLKISLKKMSGQIEFHKSIIEKVNFGKDKTYDEQFIPIFEQMKEDPNREISILNYTQTGYPNNYAVNLSKLIVQIIKTHIREFEYKNQYVKDEYFIDWQYIINELQKKIKNKKLDAKQFKRYLGMNRSDLENLITQILTKDSISINRDKYLIAESYWLLPDNNGDKVTRMYYVNPENEFKHITERFLFSCSTIINCLFSSQYKIALLPARIKNPYSDNITSYQVLHGLGSPERTMTPQSWVFSGIKTNHSKDDKLDYMFIQCKENSDAIIGTNGIHTLGYLNSIWRKLEQNKLVLFDGETLFLKRICELSDLIANKASSNSSKVGFQEEFNIFLWEVNKINSFVKKEIDCQSGLINEINANSMWYADDINNYNTFLSQNKFECNKECINKTI